MIIMGRRFVSALLSLMSSTQKLPDYSDFHPGKDRRGTLPITHLPGTASSEETDPTLEIRTLVEQLQQAAREARGQMHAVESERDDLARHLARAQQQIETLSASEREARSHFVEVASIIREKDAAMQENERGRGALAEAQKKIETLARERQEIERQRDDAVKRMDSFHREHEEQARLIGETQRQILTIRQARDTAHSQILELTNKLNRVEDERAEMEYQHELAQQAAKQAAGEAADFRRQIEAMTLDRDATARQAEQLIAQLALFQNQGGEPGNSGHGDVQIATLMAERDATAIALEAAHRQLEEARETASQREVELSAQVLALQAQAAAFESTFDAANALDEEKRSLTSRLEKQRLESIDLGTRLQSAQREIRELCASLAEARLQVKFANAAARATQAEMVKMEPVEAASPDDSMIVIEAQPAESQAAG